MKILHAPVNTANQGWLLSRGQRLLGHQADLHAAPTGALAFPADRTLVFNEGPRPERVKAIFRHFAEVLEQDYDVYHFYYHASLLPRSYGIEPFMDVDVLRGMGKKVFFHLVGCDFRLPSLSLDRNPNTMCTTCRACLDRDKVSMLERIAGSATGLIAAGAHSQLFTGGFRFDVLPVAVDLGEVQQGEAQRDVPRVVHMPTNRAIKGTDAILAAVEELHDAGVAFEFELIEGMPHTEALAHLRDADVLVDQLGSDFHATAAIEAMAMGRVVVGGMLDEARSQYGDPSPVVAANRENVRDVLARVLPDMGERQRIADAGARYAQEHHAHVRVAKRSVELYEDPTAPVPPGKSAKGIARELRAEVERTMPAFERTEGVMPVIETRIDGRPFGLGGGVDGADGHAAAGGTGSGGTAVAVAPARERTASGTAPASTDVRFPFPVDRLENPRLKQPLHERFGQGLEEYVDDKFRLGRAFYRRRLDELGLRFDGPVLDMGCGPGQWALTIAESHPDLPVTACDRNDFLYECLVEKKREMRLDNLETVQADIRELPLEDASFATTLCIGVLQLVKVSVAFGELVRVTRPGGRLLINVPGPGFYARNMVGALRGKRRDIFKQNLKFVRNTIKKQDVPFTYFTKSRLAGMAREHGLRLASVTPTGLYPPQKPKYLGLTVNMDVLFERPST